MNELAIGLLGAMLATNQPQAVSNVIQQQTGVSVPVASATDQELRQVMMGDDAAMDDVQQWIHEFDALPQTNRTQAASAELNRKIIARFDVVRAAYGAFLQKHPDSAKGYLAYGSFLTDIGDEEGAKVQYLNSKQIDPQNPAVWNQLANYYGHNGELTNAFVHYTEAIRLDPTEPIYYQNFATTVYLYRKDAREFYHINEQQVFDKALDLYRKAIALDTNSLVLATDYAISFYGIKPFRTNDALMAWTNALKTAHTDLEKEGIEIHLARTKIAAGYYEQASNHLALVTNSALQDLRKRLYRSITYHQNPTLEEEQATTDAQLDAKPASGANTNSLPAATNVVGITNSPAAPTNSSPSTSEQKP